MPEVMRPSLVPAPDRIPIPSANLRPDIPGRVIYEAPPPLSSNALLSPDFSGIQQKIKHDWVPTRGEIPTSDLVQIFREKSLLMAIELQNLTPVELDHGIQDPEKRARIIRKISNAATGCVDILTEMGFDVKGLVNDKLDVVDVKYNADKFTELRVWGTPEKPGKLSVREAAAYLKAGYDKKSGIQSYELRGLPIPPEEESARFISLKPFINWEQMRVAEWQARAFGSDLSVSASILKNMLGEHEEFLAEFDGLSSAQIDSISEVDKRNNIGDEGADFLIGSMGVLAAWGECVQQRITNTVDKMNHDYKKAPLVRDELHVAPFIALKLLREAKHRVKRGKPIPYKLAALLNVVS